MFVWPGGSLRADLGLGNQCGNNVEELRVLQVTAFVFNPELSKMRSRTADERSRFDSWLDELRQPIPGQIPSKFRQSIACP